MIRCPNAYDILLRTIMDPVDRDYMESFIGRICLGDYDSVPKYIVLYGESGSGKSTILNFLIRVFGEGKISYGTEMAKFAHSPIVIIQDGDANKIIDDTNNDYSLNKTKFFIATNKLPNYWEPTSRVLCMTGERIPVKIFNNLILPSLWEMTIPYKQYCVDKVCEYLNTKGEPID